MDKVNDDRGAPKPLFELGARRTAAAAVLADYRAELASAPLARPPGREWMLRLASVLGDLLAALGEPASAAGADSLGPFETEAGARTSPAVRAVYDAFDRAPGVGKMAVHNHRMLCEALSAAGVGLGAYDHRILLWLAGWEPQTCAVVAGLIARAHQGTRLAAGDLATVRQALTDAVMYRTAPSSGCPDCAAAPERCADHRDDASRAAGYEALLRRLVTGTEVH